MSRRAPQRTATLAALDADLVRRLVRLQEGLTTGRKPGAAVREKMRVDAERVLRQGGERLAAQARRLETRARQATPATARATRRLAALLRVRAAASLPLEAALREALEALRDAVGYERATAFAYDGGAQRLRAIAACGGHVDLIPDIAFDLGEGFSSWVAKTRRPVLLSSFREEPDMPLTDRPASFLSVPVQEGTAFFGVLNFAHRAPGAFTIADRDVAVLAGRLLAAAANENVSTTVGAADDAPRAAEAG